MTKFLAKLILLALLSLLITAVSFKVTQAQAGEVEPNNSCMTAQNLGAVALPLAFDGTLDISAASSDVDFYKLQTIPGTILEIKLLGLDSGAGTLADPFLGIFNIDCHNFATGDDDNGSPDARVTVTVPPSGLLVVAASSCCDYSFVGNEAVAGSYRLQISQLPVVGSITGRLVNGITNAPVIGGLTLNRCEGGDCSQWFRNTYTDENGRFIFDTTGTYDSPILAGDYQLTFYDTFYEAFTTAIFTVGADQNLDLGDLILTPIPVIGSISGQLVDATTNTPIINPNFYFSNAFAQLYRCNEYDCSENIGTASLDENARFRFSNDNLYYYGVPLSAGSYQISLTVATYESRLTEVFSVAVDEDLDLGQIAMTPLPRADSVRGQVVDALTGQPLTGQDYPYTRVELQRCVGPDQCYESAAGQNTGFDGTFAITTTEYGLPLLADSYQLVVTAYEHQTKIIPLELGAGEARNLNVILLEPDPIKLTNLQPCQDIPERGGRCRFSLDVTNRMNKRLNGIIWAVVHSDNTGSFLNATTFEVKSSQRVNLLSGRSKKFNFQVDIPTNVGGYVCLDIYVAQGTNTPFNTLGHEQFCIYKYANSH